MNMTALWDIALCSLVEVYRRFRGTYCHQYQGDGDRCDDERNLHLLNVGLFQRDYTALYPRRLPHSRFLCV
jgi:hypothetical protein